MRAEEESAGCGTSSAVGSAVLSRQRVFKGLDTGSTRVRREWMRVMNSDSRTAATDRPAGSLPGSRGHTQEPSRGVATAGDSPDALGLETTRPIGDSKGGRSHDGEWVSPSVFWSRVASRPCKPDQADRPDLRAVEPLLGPLGPVDRVCPEPVPLAIDDAGCCNRITEAIPRCPFESAGIIAVLHGLFGNRSTPLDAIDTDGVPRMFGTRRTAPSPDAFQTTRCRLPDAPGAVNAPFAGKVIDLIVFESLPCTRL